MKSLDLDKYLDRRYDYNKYNCGHFVAEVWYDLTGEDIKQVCSEFVNGNGEKWASLARQYRKLKEPENPCICLMRSPLLDPHVGIYINHHILHITEVGVVFSHSRYLKTFYTLSYYR